MLTKTEIAKAVEAVRALTDIVERLQKATWPETQSDVLRKSDLTDLPRASDAGGAASRALAILEDAKRRVEKLEASRDMDQQHRKTFPRDEVDR